MLFSQVSTSPELSIRVGDRKGHYSIFSFYFLENSCLITVQRFFVMERRKTSTRLKTVRCSTIIYIYVSVRPINRQHFSGNTVVIKVHLFCLYEVNFKLTYGESYSLKKTYTSRLYRFFTEYYNSKYICMDSKITK